MQVHELDGMVTKLDAIKSWGKDEPLVGVTIWVDSKQDGRTWTGHIGVPLDKVPEGLKVGSRVRLSLQLTPVIWEGTEAEASDLAADELAPHEIDGELGTDEWRQGGTG